MFGGEVDVIFIGVVVHAGLEIDAVEIPVVPPVPGHFAGLHPRKVAFCRRGERVYQVVVGQFRVFCGHDDHAPREARRTVEPGNVGFPSFDDALQPVMSSRDDFGGVGCEYAPERRARTFGREVHAGIVEQVGLRDAELFAAFAFDQYGQEGQHAVAPGRQLRIHVFVFERVPELDFGGRCAALAPHIGDVGLVVGRKPEGGPFADHGERLASGRFEPVGHARVVGAENDVVLFEPEGQFVVFVFDRLLAVNGRDDLFICAAPRRA